MVFIRIFFQYFKKSRIIKDISDLLQKKKYKQRLVHSWQTTSAVQTPSRLYLDITQKLNVIYNPCFVIGAGFDLTTRDSYFTILVEVFMSRISVEN